MKKFKTFLLLILIMPCIFLFNACSFFADNTIYVTDIVQGETVDGVTSYTIIYSNGKTSLFSVNNGKDGENGKDLTIESIKAYCEANKIDFNSFLKEYLTIVEEQQSVQDASNIAIQSAVTIWCEFPIISGYQKYNKLACGAGVIYKMEDEVSYILTNYHVIYWYGCETENDFAKNVTLFQYGTSETVYNTNLTENGYPVYQYGDGAVNAEVVGGSMQYDLALLKVNTADLLKYNEHAKAVTIADGYELGETAIAIGNPECEGFSVTSGIISVESEELTMYAADDIHTYDYRVIRIDTAVNGGNSGGGLFNINGELIGIVNAKAIASEIDNIAFAIPFDNAVAVAENLLYYHQKSPTKIATVKFLNLGITYSAENSRAVYNPTTNRTIIKEDVVVDMLTAGYASNLHIYIGDIITKISINGVEHNITRTFQIEDLMLTVREDDKVVITITRNKATQDLGSTITGVSSTYFSEVL